MSDDLRAAERVGDLRVTGRVEIVEGRARLVELVVAAPQGATITNEDLRRIAPTRLAAAAVAARPPALLPAPLRLSPADRRQGYPLGHWDDVARVWHEARERGVSTRRAIAEWGGVAPSTADLWIRRARNLGLIPETRRDRT